MDHPSGQLPTQQAFSEVLNSRFNVWEDGRKQVEFTLVECNDVLSTEWQQCYSLLFRGPTDQPPVQSIYLLENEQLGRMELFLVPVKRDDAGVYFEAVMNHLVKR